MLVMTGGRDVPLTADGAIDWRQVATPTIAPLDLGASPVGGADWTPDAPPVFRAGVTVTDWLPYAALGLLLWLVIRQRR